MSFDSPSPTSPRRFRFGLRTLFVVVTVAACWCSYSANWIRQRREAVRSQLVELGDTKRCRAPSGLWLLGESGFVELTTKTLDPIEQDRIEKMFPEAELWIEVKTVEEFFEPAILTPTHF